MSTPPSSDAATKNSARPRRLLWDGVLPEALGLCFVAIIFSGFSAAYLLANHSWRAQATIDQQASAEALARAWATGLAALPPDAAESAEALLSALGNVPGLRAIQWLGTDGAIRFNWPRIRPLLGIAGNPNFAGDAGPARLSGACVPVTAGDGTSRGQLRLELAPPSTAQYQATLLWNWGIAAGVTLTVFAACYHRLRRHLRPVAAIERSLSSYATGLEQELGALRLSDSLGRVAQGWNALIEQVTDLRRQLQNVRDAGHTDVLARFEGAVFRRVVDRLPFGVMCVGDDQTISYANPTAAGLLGVSAGAAAGRPVAELIDNPSVVQAIATTGSRSAAGLVLDHTRKEGERELLLRFRILLLTGQANSREALVTVEDISQLRESQRARDNFLYHVTHELRTPLTNIHAYAETLTKPGFDDEQTRKECYNVLTSETQRLSRLVEDILCISQMEVGTARIALDDVDLTRLIRQMVQDNLGGADEKHIDLTLSLPPKLPKIQGDKQRLSVLLNNLIGNAVKYTPEGGKVQVLVEADEKVLKVAVSDTGIGIPEADQAKIFDKFYRAADERVQMIAGTGLGLTLAREVARLHGGDIHLTSEPGQGSTFTFELPLSPVQQTEVTAA